jgi:hypothetical protein
MTAQTSSPRLMSRGDAVAMVVFMMAGAAIAVVTLIGAVIRISEVLPGSDVDVYAEFAGTPAHAPIGVDGADVTVALDTAWITAPTLPTFSVVALVIQQIALAVAVTAVVACLLAVTWNILRGRMFSRTNTRLVTGAGFFGLLGFAAVPFFGNMGANGAFAELSENTFDNVVMSVDLFPLVGAAFVAALATMTFTVGDRLRRDTEGLV